LGAETVRRAFSLRKFFSPMPLTFIRSSIFLNGPFFWRYSRIRSAIFAPIPGRFSRSVADAVLRLTVGPAFSTVGAGACAWAHTGASRNTPSNAASSRDTMAPPSK
jgi:hypothetical protein